MYKNKYFQILKTRFLEKNPLIQVLLGPRQVGKTTIAEALFNSWDGPKIMVSADNPSPPTSEWVRFHWEQARLKGEGTLLIIDEVQKIPGWSEQIKSLVDEDRRGVKIKALLLGSSALYLQKGLKESLAGRFELIEVPHWTLGDFEKTFGWDFDKYIRFGAYPGAASFAEDEERWRNYILHSIVEPVIGKDILGSHPVSKPALFRQTFELATHYPAQVVSFQKLLGQLQDFGNTTTIKDYLNLMEQSFLLLCLQKYSGSYLQTKSASPKIIISNPALIHAYTSQSHLRANPQWYGFVFESLVGYHLSRIPNSQLYYWRDRNLEVDFILQTPKNLWAIEVKSGSKAKTGKGLTAFLKEYPKAICEVWDYAKSVEFMRSGVLGE